MRTAMKVRLLAISLALCVFGIAGASMAAAEDALPTRLTFVSARPGEDPVTRWLILIYTEALRRMDIEFVYRDVPPKRASAYSDSGKVDGELGRAHNYNEAHPEMVRVEEPNTLVKVSAFTVDPQITLQGWESFQGTPYRVEYRNGIAVCEARLPQVVPPDRLSAITTVAQGIQKLLYGRTDVYIDVAAYVADYLDSREFQEIRMGRTVYTAGVMEQTTGHAFLHKKHRALVPKLSAILHQMKQEGVFGAYRDQVGLGAEDVTW